MTNEICNQTACKKLIESEWNNLLEGEWTWIPKKPENIISDRKIGIVLRAQYGQFKHAKDVVENEKIMEAGKPRLKQVKKKGKGIHIDMNNGDLKKKLIQLAEVEGTGDILYNQDIDLIFKFIKLEGDSSSGEVDDVGATDNLKDIFGGPFAFNSSINVKGEEETIGHKFETVEVKAD